MIARPIGNIFWRGLGARVHGDSAYWAIENIRQTKKRELVPNFVPREGADGGLVLGQALKEYDNKARKKFQGMVEGFFGGLATHQGTTCRLIGHQSKVVLGYALVLGQQIRTYMRFKLLTLWLYFRTNPCALTTLISTRRMRFLRWLDGS